ncbi:hypothetical protein FOXYSP1_11942 [Fusarium oxysporum f. sp. phaseoli]
MIPRRWNMYSNIHLLMWLLSLSLCVRIQTMIHHKSLQTVCWSFT